jgi:hypothetical protein
MINLRRVSGRLMGLGLALLAISVFIGYDAFDKLRWAEVPATIATVQPKCEMSSEQYLGLTRKTSRETVECGSVEAFRTMHPEKAWKLNQSWLLGLLVAGPRPVKTTMMVYVDAELTPGAALSVIQNPGDPGSVLPTFRGRGNLDMAGTIALLGLAWMIPSLFLRWPKPIPVDRWPQDWQISEPESDADPPAPPPLREPSITTPRRVFGRRGIDG